MRLPNAKGRVCALSYINFMVVVRNVTMCIPCKKARAATRIACGKKFLRLEITQYSRHDVRAWAANGNGFRNRRDKILAAGKPGTGSQALNINSIVLTRATFRQKDARDRRGLFNSSLQLTDTTTAFRMGFWLDTSV